MPRASLLGRDADGATGYPATDNQDTCGEFVTFSAVTVADGRVALAAAPPLAATTVEEGAPGHAKADSLAHAWSAVLTEAA